MINVIYYLLRINKHCRVLMLNENLVNTILFKTVYFYKTNFDTHTVEKSINCMIKKIISNKEILALQNMLVG